MGLRGPPKTPTALKLVAGNPGKRALPKNEPKPPITCPDPPDYLPETAKVEWRRVCPRLAELGLMSDIDIAVLAGYCGCFADLLDATDKQRGRATVLKTHNGNWVQSPFVSMIRQARLDMVRFAAQLGMTPAARAGMDIQIGNPETPGKPAEGSAARFF
jgi:P27 family predicted phage terminase small subunit